MVKNKVANLIFCLLAILSLEWFIHSHGFSLSPPDNFPIYITGTFLPHFHQTSVFLYYFKSIILVSSLAKQAPPPKFPVVEPHYPSSRLGTLVLPLMYPLLQPHDLVLVHSDFNCFFYIFVLFYHHRFMFIVLFLINLKITQAHLIIHCSF